MAERRMTGEYIQDADQLEIVIKALEGADTFFLDTEFESYRGGTELSLIQVTDGVHAFIIDAMTISDLTPLRETLGHGNVLWVVHAGKQDVALLMDALRLRRRPDIFDTQVAWSLWDPSIKYRWRTWRPSSSVFGRAKADKPIIGSDGP